jgi:hypothetical protein
MAKYRDYEIHDLHGRVRKGFEHAEKAEPGSKTFNPETLKTTPLDGLIGQNTFDQTHAAYQKPQAREDRQDQRYDNDVKSGWLRGSDQDATTYPNFDHRDKATGLPKKW